MKLFKIMLAVLLLSGIFVAQDFEGYLKYNVKGDKGEAMAITYYKKGDMVKMEPEITQQISIIMKDGKTYMVMPAQGMYMEFDSKISEQINEADSIKKPVKTGETKTILGYEAEKWIFEDANYTSEIWASDKLGKFVALSSPMQRNQMPDWYSEIVDNNFFPLLIEAKDKDGSIAGSMEVVEITPTPLKDGFFEIPEGYKKLEMPAGANQFGR